MKQKFLSLLSLFAICASFAGTAAAQSAKKARPSDTSVPTARQLAADASTSISDAAAYADNINGAYVDWSTSFEKGILGFNIYRVNANGEKVKANTEMIGGAIMSRSEKLPVQSGGSYIWYDSDGSPDAAYYIESISTAGATRSYGPLSAIRVSDISGRLGYTRRSHERAVAENNSRIQTSMPASIRASEKNIRRAAADPDAQKWVAAQPGVKMFVRDRGIYRVTRAQLQTAGFDVNSPIGNWQLYLNGVQQGINVEAAGNYIEFYGFGQDIQHSDSNVYYLVAGPGPGKRIPAVNRRPFSAPVIPKSFRDSIRFEQRTFYNMNVINGDLDNWFGSNVSSVAPVRKNIVAKEVDATHPFGIDVEVSVHGLQDTPHSLRVMLNGVQLGIMNFNGITAAKATYTTKSAMLRTGDNELEFQSLLLPVDNTMLDYVNIEYPRKYKADQNSLAFDVLNMRGAKLSGFTTSDVRVFDIALPTEPVIVGNATVTPGAESTFEVNIPSGRGHPMIAVTEASLKSPVSIVANTPSTLSASSSNAAMLIISHPNFLTQANDWANYRRAQGITVDVINVVDIYDEFDFGLATPDALKGYYRYAITNFPNLKYAMMVGDSTYDPRNYLGIGYNDFIPSKTMNASFAESPSDETLGDMDNDGVSEIAIGRLPVRNASEIAPLLAKVTAFESVVTTSLANRGVLFVADRNDGYDFETVNRLLAAELPAGTPHSFIDLGENDPVVIRQAIVSDINANNGRFIVNYTGHGSTRIWSSLQIFRQLVVQPPSELQQLTNSGNKLSLFLMLTCLNGFFTDPTQDNLAEAIFKAPNGGSATTWASTGSTTADIQQEMATRFFHILGQGTYSRLGDAVKASKQNALNTDVPLTWAIMGDPALKVK